MSNITEKTYKTYLIHLKDMVYKILPLFEEDNPHIYEYLDSVIFEIVGLKDDISNLPHEHWYVKVLAILRAIESHSFTSEDQKKIKKEVFRMLSAIDKQIEEIKT
ncbi:hypothetical protein [Siminovitchia sp. 179-K 8D1 HS]|uniref:hypothetical protein n=1 Tax=Siminovitchia sp. 179-K 8D1 HS TaxID=3142385 RepID=UPI0039A04212